MKVNIGKEHPGERKGDQKISIKMEWEVPFEQNASSTLPFHVAYIYSYHTMSLFSLFFWQNLSYWNTVGCDLKFSSLSRFETIGERTQLQDVLLGQLSCRGLIALFIFMLIY